MYHKRILRIYWQEVRNSGFGFWIPLFLLLACVLCKLLIYSQYPQADMRHYYFNLTVSLLAPLGGSVLVAAVLERYVSSPDRGLYSLYQRQRGYVLRASLLLYLPFLALLFWYVAKCDSQMTRQFPILLWAVVLLAESTYILAFLLRSAAASMALVVVYQLFSCLIYQGKAHWLVWFSLAGSGRETLSGVAIEFFFVVALRLLIFVKQYYDS